MGAVRQTCKGLSVRNEEASFNCINANIGSRRSNLSHCLIIVSGEFCSSGSATGHGDMLSEDMGAEEVLETSDVR